MGSGRHRVLSQEQTAHLVRFERLRQRLDRQHRRARRLLPLLTNSAIAERAGVPRRIVGDQKRLSRKQQDYIRRSFALRARLRRWKERKFRYALFRSKRSLAVRMGICKGTLSNYLHDGHRRQKLRRSGLSL